MSEKGGAEWRKTAAKLAVSQPLSATDWRAHRRAVQLGEYDIPPLAASEPPPSPDEEETLF